MGRFGGPLLLPDGMADPEEPYVASIDLAALPKESTDLSLPPDGHLLLFAWIWDAYECCNHGQAIYVPAGTPVVERDRNAWNKDQAEGEEWRQEYQEVFGNFPQRELRARTEPSLPNPYLAELLEKDAGAAGFRHLDELERLWGSTGHGPVDDRYLRIGGHAENDLLKDIVHAAVHSAEEGTWGGGEPVSEAVDDWVMLAHWQAMDDLEEVDSVHWGIQRADLAARRFDRVSCTVYWNP
ncbi:DUF1963 domain-containing protein [Streptomyces sp. NPDC048106]|uniref:DUF1963 domain-containing protein n=1 Tax=Streptomyces sp. NPDC048106 TaxID=3155750 RepID=UPI003455E313